MLQSRPSRNVALLAAVVVTQLLDLLRFVPAVGRVGIGAESNPFARALYGSMGASGPAMLKLAAMALMLAVLFRVTRRFPMWVLPAALLAAGLGLAGFASNV